MRCHQWWRPSSSTWREVEALLPLLPLPQATWASLVAELPLVPFCPDSTCGWLLPWHCLVALLPLPFPLLLLLPIWALLLPMPSLLPLPLGALPSPERSSSPPAAAFCSPCRLSGALQGEYRDLQVATCAQHRQAVPAGKYSPVGLLTLVRALRQAGVVAQLQPRHGMLLGAHDKGRLLLQVERLRGAADRLSLTCMPGGAGGTPGTHVSQYKVHSTAHPAPPIDARPQVAQLVVPQGLDHVVCSPQLEAGHHGVPVLLGGHHCKDQQPSGAQQANVMPPPLVNTVTRQGPCFWGIMGNVL